MLFIYGDSHAYYNFRNIDLPHIFKHQPGTTLHRVGRDNNILHFDSSEHTGQDSLVFSFGEIDCRCHIQRQIDLGRSGGEVIDTLVKKYFNALLTNIQKFKHVVVVAVVPPTEQLDYERKHGPILAEHPFVGSDANRARFTVKINNLIKEYCVLNNYIYFDPYDYYTRENGCLKHELSDNTVHIGDNTHILNEFINQFSV